MMEDDQEPQLKYSQLGADAHVILARDEATCFAASDKLHVLGCSNGSIHVLDIEGNQVRCLSMVSIDGHRS
jgi:vacuolar protein sorting-associated protein 41